jgi:L,D-transpeptidase-like protein
MKSRSIAHVALLLLLSLPVMATFAQDACADVAGCSPTTGLPAEVMAAYPQPNVNPLPITDSDLYDRIYKKMAGGAQIFDAPGGNLLETMGPGFTYITVNSTQDDWTQIDEGQWVPSNVLTDDVTISRYSGVFLPDDPLPYPMAWTMKHLNASTAPGGNPWEDNPFMYRYTRVNLYDYVEVDGKRWYQIGPDQWVHQFDLAKMTPIGKPPGVDTHKWVGVDLYEQTLIAYEDDKPVFATLISSGLKDWGTNEGLFHVYLRYARTTMSGAQQQSDFYFLQEVPWVMYFDHDIALHGTYWHDGFGYRHSHGCVNMSITDAKWLYDWSADESDFSVPNDKGMAVYVYSSGTYDS